MLSWGITGIDEIWLKSCVKCETNQEKLDPWANESRPFKSNWELSKPNIFPKDNITTIFGTYKGSR